MKICVEKASGIATELWWERGCNVLSYLTTDSTHDFSSCGVAGDTSPIRGRVIGGIDSREAAWPWQAGIYWQRDDGSVCIHSLPCIDMEILKISQRP